MSADPRQSGTSGGARLAFEQPAWDEVQRAILAGRRLRAQWLRQQTVRLGGHLRRWLELVRRAQQRRAELSGLLALDDHTLADIGLRRGDLKAVHYGVVPWEAVFSPRSERHWAPSGEVVPLGRGERPRVAPSDLSKAA